MMKLIIRADDVGYTPFANFGTIKAIDEGIVTTADVMLDCPGAVDALKQLAERPWISVGWHAGHQWGKPVLGADKVPSLVDEEGNFKWAMKDGLKLGYAAPVPDRKVLNARKNEVVYEEALTEFRAELDLCVQALGRAPDTATAADGPSLVDKARKQAMDEYGVKYGWFTKGPGGKDPNGVPCHPEYSALNIYMPCQKYGTNKNMLEIESYRMKDPYDPVEGFLNDGDGIAGHEVVQLAFHPAFLDDVICYDGGLQFIMNRARIIDVHAMCDPRLRQWIKDNRIELINQRDALYGTKEYQNHLKQIGSDLYMGN